MFPTGTSNDRPLLKSDDGLGRMQPPLDVCHQLVSLKFFVPIIIETNYILFMYMYVPTMHINPIKGIVLELDLRMMFDF